MILIPWELCTTDPLSKETLKMLLSLGSEDLNMLRRYRFKDCNDKIIAQGSDNRSLLIGCLHYLPAEYGECAVYSIEKLIAAGNMGFLPVLKAWLYLSKDKNTELDKFSHNMTGTERLMELVETILYRFEEERLTRLDASDIDTSTSNI